MTTKQVLFPFWSNRGLRVAQVGDRIVNAEVFKPSLHNPVRRARRREHDPAKVLRGQQFVAAAPKPMIGFGNSVFDRTLQITGRPKVETLNRSLERRTVHEGILRQRVSRRLQCRGNQEISARRAQDRRHKGGKQRRYRRGAGSHLRLAGRWHGLALHPRGRQGAFSESSDIQARQNAE
jgi:hypothetical protein